MAGGDIRMGLGGVVRLFHSSAVVIGDGIQSSLVSLESGLSVLDLLLEVLNLGLPVSQISLSISPLVAQLLDVLSSLGSMLAQNRAELLQSSAQLELGLDVGITLVAGCATGGGVGLDDLFLAIEDLVELILHLLELSLSCGLVSLDQVFSLSLNLLELFVLGEEIILLLLEVGELLLEVIEQLLGRGNQLGVHFLSVNAKELLEHVVEAILLCIHSGDLGLQSIDLLLQVGDFALQILGGSLVVLNALGDGSEILLSNLHSKLSIVRLLVDVKGLGVLESLVADAVFIETTSGHSICTGLLNGCLSLHHILGQRQQLFVVALGSRGGHGQP